MSKKSDKLRIKVCCPYCQRISTLKNISIGECSAVADYYYFEDIQCNLCGSYYDLRMDFYPSNRRQNALKRKRLKLQNKSYFPLTFHKYMV